MTNKKFIKRVLREFVYGGQIVALAGSSVVAMVLVLAQQKIDIKIIGLPYVILHFIYGFNYIKEVQFDRITNPERAAFIERRRAAWLWLVFYLVLLVILVVLIPLRTIIFSLMLIGAGLLFTTHFKQVTSKLLGFKNFYVALMWALLVPLTFNYYHLPILNLKCLIVFLFVFLRSFINAVLFDVKDIKSDSSRHLKTFPVIYGKVATINFLQILNVISFILVVLGVAMKAIPRDALVLLLLLPYSAIYQRLLKRHADAKLRIISYTLIDAEDIIAAGLLLFITAIK